MSHRRLITNDVYDDVYDEMLRQDDKWGDQSSNSLGTWFSILGEEVGEAHTAHLNDNLSHLAEELIQVAAVAVQFAASVRLGLQEKS